MWDEEADPLVASVLDRGDVPRVNELLRTWTKNGQPLPAGLPADLRDFMERARRLPPWADQRRLATAVEFNKKRGLYLGVLYGLASGMMSTVIPKEARAVYYSQGGADMKDRISKTAKLGYDIGALDAYQPDGGMIVTCVKTRLVHATAIARPDQDRPSRIRGPKPEGRRRPWLASPPAGAWPPWHRSAASPPKAAESPTPTSTACATSTAAAPTSVSAKPSEQVPSIRPARIVRSSVRPAAPHTVTDCPRALRVRHCGPGRAKG
ncbi:hypothetical protein [Streptosporangium sp. NPDC003464]